MSGLVTSRPLQDRAEPGPDSGLNRRWRKDWGPDLGRQRPRPAQGRLELALRGDQGRHLGWLGQGSVCGPVQGVPGPGRLQQLIWRELRQQQVRGPELVPTSWLGRPHHDRPGHRGWGDGLDPEWSQVPSPR